MVRWDNINVKETNVAPRSSKLCTSNDASSDVRKTESGRCNRSSIGDVYSRFEFGWIEITVPADSWILYRDYNSRALLTIIQQEYKHGLMPNKHPVSLLQCFYLQPLLFPGL